MPLSLELLSYIAIHFGAMARSPESRRRLFNILKKFLIMVWGSIAVYIISFFLLIATFGHLAHVQDGLFDNIFMEEAATSTTAATAQEGFNDVIQGMQHYTELVPYDGDVMLHVGSDGPI